MTKAESVTARRAFHWADSHPWLVVSSLLLWMAARNSSFFTVADVVVLLGIGVIVSTVIWGLCRLFTSNSPAAALMATVTLLTVLIYGKVFDQVNARLAFGAGIVHGLLVLGWGSVMVYLIRSRGDWSRSATMLNLTAILMMLQPLGQLASLTLRPPQFTGLPAVVAADTPANPLKELPDIYYLLLDGYGRADALQEEFGFDNTPFLDALRDQGFYVADRSYSNYPITLYSLSSSLNMQLHTPVPCDGGQPLAALELMRNNQVAGLLQRHGYEIVHFNSLYEGTAFSRQADRTFGALHGMSPTLTNFWRRIRGASACRFGTPSEATDWRVSHEQYFAELPKQAAKPGPKFVFAHMLCPHYPYVFDAQGRRTEGIPDENTRGYTAQIEGLNRQLLPMLAEIQAKSARPPIIVIQADHGAVWLPYSSDPAREVRQRLGILHALLVPESIRQQLDPAISPVNSFRLILKEVLGLPIDRIPDEHFLVTYETLTKPVNVTKLVRPEEYGSERATITPVSHTVVE